MTMNTRSLFRPIALVIVISGMLASTGCTPSPEPPAATGLAAAYEGKFRIGAALGAFQVSGRDTVAAGLMGHFNTATPENVLKWESVHPKPDSFAFGPADDYVAFAERHGMFVIGHTLVWHQQTPRWVFENEDGTEISRDALVARMQDHIRTVVNRYKGRVKGWDVVNEALNEDGTLRDSPWRRIIGDDFIRIAFETANEADPDAELYYNDYSLANTPKAQGAVNIVKALQDAGVRVDGIGAQGHYKMDWPSPARFDSALVLLASTGLPVKITELDIDLLPFGRINRGADLDVVAEQVAALNPYVDGLPDSMQTALANRYGELFEVLVRRADIVDRVTFWGVHDGMSWLNGWPIPRRTSYPLLFDRSGAPKPAYDAVLRAAGN